MWTLEMSFYILSALAFSFRSSLALDHGKLADDALRLIAEGDKSIIANQKHKDIILVLGNTGAGKTTITKFLAEVNELEAYDVGDRYLIRDKQQKISEKSTLVSKTIFPDLIIDKATNNAFYDLPGFGDTRNASVEIANAWFMKKVADNARRVKILLIVNYNSLLNGGTRTAFKTALELATDLIKNPAKFKSSIALVATKVESTRSPDSIINGIGSFLKTTKDDLPKVFSDSSKRQAASNLIDALLSKDGLGKYNKISFFQQPEDEGRVVNIPEVMARRPHMVNVVYRNIVFTGSSAEDFGFSISPAGKLIVKKIAEKVNQNFRETFIKISEEMKTHYAGKVGSTSLEKLVELLAEQDKIAEVVVKLSKSKTRKEFLETFNLFQTQLANKLAFQGVDVIQNRAENLEFFEKISNQIFPTPILDWVHPFRTFENSLKNAINTKVTALNNQIQTKCDQIASSLTNHFRTLVEKAEEKIPKMEAAVRTLTHSNQKLLEMVRTLETSKSVNEFIRNIRARLPAIAHIPGSNNNWIHVNQDIKLSGDKRVQFVFSVTRWLRNIKPLSPFLIGQQSFMKNKIQTEKNRLVREEGERKRKLETERQQKLERVRLEREKKLREGRELKQRLEIERLNKQKEQQRKERERKQRQLEEQQRIQNQRKKQAWGLGGFTFSLNIGK